MTFRGLGIWDLGIIGLGFVNSGNWVASFRAVKPWVEERAQWHQRTGRALKERGPRFVGTSIKMEE